MTRRIGPCFGCGQTKPLSVDFCQACNGKIEPAMQISIRRIRSLETSLAVTVGKLESIGIAIVARRRQFGAIYLLHHLLTTKERGRLQAAVETIIRGLEMERPILIGRIARQRTYIDMMRRKLGVKR